MKTSDKIVFAAVLGFASSVANAALIDFTDRSSWGESGSGAVTTSIDGLSISLQAFGANGPTTYTNTRFDGGAFDCRMLACQSDGIGIIDDEISFGSGAPGEIERLTISFSEAVTVESIFFLDLFGAVGGDRAGAETAYVSANGLGAAWAGWTGIATGGAGLFEATLNNMTAASHSSVLSSITTLDFFTTDFGAFEASWNSDFALAALQVRRTSLPEPGTFGLLATAVLGFMLTRRKSR